MRLIFPAWPLGIRSVILLSRHTFLFFFLSPSVAEQREGFFPLFYMVDQRGLIEEKNASLINLKEQEPVGAPPWLLSMTGS